MRFLAITLIVPGPDPLTGRQKSTADRFQEVVAPALSGEIADPPWDQTRHRRGPGESLSNP